MPVYQPPAYQPPVYQPAMPPVGRPPRDQRIPTINRTLRYTAWFGWIGAFAAHRDAKRARALGASGKKYWVTFWIATLCNNLIILLIVGVVLYDLITGHRG